MARRVWKKYRVLVLFLVGLVALDFVVGFLGPVWDRYAPDDYLERIHRCESQRQDILIIGGSPVSEGIDPSFLDGKAFALGLPGATASELWLASQLAVPQPPRILIYGCTASDWNDRRQEPHGPHSLMTWNDLGVWCRHRPESREWVTRHFLQSRLAQSWDLFQYRHGMRLWAAHQLEDVFPEAALEARDARQYGDALRTGNGYAPNPKYLTKFYDLEKLKSDPQIYIPHLKNYTLGGHMLYLGWMLDWAKSNGVKVIFLDMPVTEDLEVRMHPDEFRRYREKLAEIASERGYPVLHATRSAIGVDDHDFADVIHLNGVGAQKMSRWLRSQLEAMR